MITIEMKIELFSKMVREKALLDPKRKLEELNIKHAQILDDMEVKCEESRSDFLMEIQNKAIAKKRKKVAKANYEVQNRILIKKKELFEALKNDLIDEVKKSVRSKGYERYFEEKFERVMKTRNASEKPVVWVRSDDVKLLPKGTDIGIDDELLGGFYIIVGEREKYDFSLNGEVDGLDDYLGCMLSNLFDHTREACDEG